jgi:hypothetical protein
VLEQFRSCVHAEETAIQSTLAYLKEEITQFDPVVVAFPHLVDNNDLVMTDELFENSLKTRSLFIRKRPAKLSSRVEGHIIRSHYFPDIADCLQEGVIDGVSRPSSIKSIYDEIAKYFADHPLGSRDILLHEVRSMPTPTLHINISNISDDSRFTVRIISENLEDFKVCLIEESETGDIFEQPYIDDQNLISTIRVRVYGMFRHREIVPLTDSARGFVSVPLGGSLDDVCAAARGRVMLAMSIAHRL